MNDDELKLKGQKNTYTKNALVAPLDVYPIGDHGFAGLIPTWSGNILSWRLIIKYFLRSFSPFC